MAIGKNKNSAMTLVEMIVAMAILVIVMAAVVPQLRCVQNSWASKQNSSEIVQNGRVLIDHITANLSQAARVTAISASNNDNGYIEYLNTDGNTVRYDLKNNGNIEFGMIGSLFELAGPASKLRFACYDVNNPDLPIIDPNRIRIVNVEVVISGQMFTTKAFIRTNALYNNLGVPLMFESSNCQAPAEVSIDNAHHLCVYEGEGSGGYAAVLNTDSATHTVMLLSSYEFASTGRTPAIAKIDTWHYLCAYEGDNYDGWAVILQVNPSTWTISKGTEFEFDTLEGRQSALSQIDATHFLCVYSGPNSNGYAVILTVNIGAGTITKGTEFKFDADNCVNPALTKIDTTHYLCVYTGKNDAGYAAILVPNMSDETITSLISFEFESFNCGHPSLAHIDSTHYLCAFAGQDNDGFAMILTAGISPPAITKSQPYEFDMQNGGQPSLIKIDNGRYLCTYQTNNLLGKAAILAIDTITGKVSIESAFKFDNDFCGASTVALADQMWFLCVYESLSSNGCAIMINTEFQVLP